MASTDGTQPDVEKTEEVVVGPGTKDALCDICEKIFESSPSDFQCSFHRRGIHFHVGRVDKFLSKEPGTWPCRGCRLVGKIVCNMRAMIRRNDHGISPDLAATGVTAELKLLEEMVPTGSDADKSLKIEMRPAARVISVKVDVLPGIAGTIIKTGNTPDSHRVHGMHIPPRIDIDRTRRWLATCRDGHASCRRTVASPVATSTPTTLSVEDTNFIRLIDVNTRQIVPCDLEAEFAALSYVWGKDTQPLLTKARLQLYSEPRGLDQANLPKTISNAISLVKDLGLQYIWVDSICIIQDDDADKQRQLPRMAALYEAAELVIVAAAGRDASAGLSGYNTDRPDLQATENINGVNLTTFQGGLHDVLRWTHWDRRGWTYQEAFQARRALIMLDTLAYWSCRDTMWREDLDSDQGGGVRLRKDGGALWRYTPDGQRTLGCTPNTYFTSVEHFCLRSLREGSDALWAYWGVLGHQSVRFPPNGYLWGHPYGNHGRRSAKAFHGILIEDGPTLKVPFPSWSWLSVDTSVEFLDTCGSSVVSAVEWQPPITLWNPLSSEIYLTYLERIGVEGVDKAKQMLSKTDGKLHPAPTPGRPFAMDYGLLCFTAEVAQLTLSLKYEHTGDKNCPCRLKADPGKETTHTYATVRDGDKEVGSVTVPLSLFKDGATEATADVVHISSVAVPRTATDDLCKVQPASGCQEVQHVRGCQHLQFHNLMVVSWEVGIAYRQALLAMEQSVWQSIPSDKRVTKRVILG